MSFLTKYSAPNVLFLPNVSFRDIVSLDKLWGDHDTAETNGKNRKKSRHTKLPKEFFGLDTWVLESNLSCCSCHFKYNTIPISMPIRLIKNQKGDVGFAVDYNYCSFPCCAHAIVSINDTYLREYRMEMLKMMFKYFFCIDLEKKSIDTSPGVEEREDHGGDLSPLDFRKKINRIITFLLNDIKQDDIDINKYILDLNHPV